jgi:FkbM family methyltransferase
MKDLARKISRRLTHYYKALILREPQAVTINHWFRDKGDTTLRVNYPLTEKSIVFDLGGYKGDWADTIVKKYNPFIFIFEPVPDYYKLIVDKFQGNSKVKVYQFGLSSTNTSEKISILQEASSIYRDGNEDNSDKIDINLKDIKEFLKAEKIASVELIKINIEGGEYPLLQYMIKEELIPIFQELQIQFHTCYPNPHACRLDIRESLQKTHSLTYDYPFVWENWSKKTN